MYTIKTLNAISPVGLAKLNKNLFDVSVGADAPDGILVRSADLLNTTFNENLLAIARAGAGVNNIPLDRCSEQGIVVEGLSNCLVKFSKCCTPVPGDEIVGFITRGYGVSVHRCDCPNAKRMRENYPYRVIDARWRQSAEGAFRVTIRIVAADTTGMANHITEVIVRDLKLGIRSMNFAPAGNGCVAGEVAVEVPGTAVVDTLIHQIMRIKGVQRAYRVN